MCTPVYACMRFHIHRSTVPYTAGYGARVPRAAAPGDVRVRVRGTTRTRTRARRVCVREVRRGCACVWLASRLLTMTAGRPELSLSWQRCRSAIATLGRALSCIHVDYNVMYHAGPSSTLPPPKKSKET